MPVPVEPWSPGASDGPSVPVASDAHQADPLRTGVLRERVRAVWAAAPARFREDANAEEDLALGGYRDRVVIELAQNAADAAARAGGRGRLRLSLRGGVLTASNTGVPLDPAGAEALSSLRTSAKAEDTSAVGRFGVGFTAVLAVSDAPALVSHHGGIRWSRADAAAFARGVPGLDAELARRQDRVPVLRVPFVAHGRPEDGYDTDVVLPLRDSAAEDLVRQLLHECDDALLLALPPLAEVVVDVDGDTRVLTSHQDDGAHGIGAVEVTDGATVTRWVVGRAGGPLDPDLLADRPVEEHLRPEWSLAWAVPVDDAGMPTTPRTPRVLHAPTPSDEPVDLPALLIASFPMDSSRRRPVSGPLSDHLIDAAARSYAVLLAEWPIPPAARAFQPLLPGPVAAGAFDARLKAAIAERLAVTPFLPSAPDTGGVPADADGSERIRPRDAVLLDGATPALTDVFAPLVGGLLPADWSAAAGAIARLGTRRITLGDAIDILASVDRPPAWWHDMYDACAAATSAGASSADVDSLGGLPVPLADGRTVRGPRGLLLPDGLPADELGADQPGASGPGAGGPGAGGPDGDERRRDERWADEMPDTVNGVEPAGDEPRATVADAARTLGVRLVHPRAAHPLLERLGAHRATPRAILGEGSVRVAVAGSFDADDPDEVAEAVLTLVRAARPAPGEEPWLAELALPDEDGLLVPAGDLVLPGSALADIAEEDGFAVVEPELVRRWGTDVLLRVGVMDTLELVRDDDALIDPESFDHDLDGEQEWCADTLELAEGDGRPDTWGEPAAVAGACVVAEFTAVRDLDLIAADRWPSALALLARPPLRQAVTEPARVLRPDGGSADVASYTAWWLRNHTVLDGRRPTAFRATDSDMVLAGLYETVAPAVVAGLDPTFTAAIGVRTTVAALLAEPGGPAELLDRLADPARPVGAAQLAALYTVLAGVDPGRLDPPPAVRALEDSGRATDDPPRDPAGIGQPATVVVPGESAVVVEAPDLLPVVRGRPVLPVAPVRAAALADLLAVPTAGELVDAVVLGGGEAREQPVPPLARLLLPGVPDVYVEHDELRVAVGGRGGADPRTGGVAVDWRFDDGVLHAATLDGLADGLAWAAGAWGRRHELARALGEPERASSFLVERLFEAD